jgi:long-chain acyl-CoA synthetase
MEAATAATDAGATALHAGDLCEAFARTVARYGSSPALRSSDGATTLSWREFDARMRAVAGGLSALGLAPGGTVAMLLTNRVESALIDMATLHVGAVPVSLYNTSSVEQLTYLLGDCRADVVVTESALAGRVREAVALTSPRPKLVIIDSGGEEGVDASSLQALCALGPALPAGAHPSLSPDDIVTVVYTSGTTGIPKGAELTHDNILAQIRGLHTMGRLPDGGSVLSYLPFAHLGDRLCAYYMPVVMGATITYHPDPRTAVDLLPQVAPTLFMAVPRIWQKVEISARQRIAAAPAQEREALEAAVALGLQLHADRVAGREVDERARAEWLDHDPVLAPLRAGLGIDAGELLFTGAAPLPPETLGFFASIGVILCECYGQSETAGIVICNPADRARPQTIGLPMPGAQAKLADDGELLVKGPMVMAGYRGKPELTAAAFDEEGWLRTGDIAVTDDAGYYRIVDRKKEIIISASGKNMSPAHIENTISTGSPLIGVVACIGEARPYNTALIALEWEAAAAMTSVADPASNARDPAVVAAVAEGVRAANERLNRSEQIKRFLLVEQPWLPGGDELTPTMKLRRKAIDAKHGADIDSLYGDRTERVIDVS